MAKRVLHNVLFPKQRKILTCFGEDLLLAMKRSGYQVAKHKIAGRFKMSREIVEVYAH